MGSEWTATTLGELCAKQGGSIQTGPFGSQLHASDYGETGTPVVMPVNLVHGNVSENGIARVSKEHVTKLSRHKLQPSDIVFSRRGDVTRFAQITERESGWLCGTGCLKISLGKEQFAASQFIAGVLSLSETKAWLVQHAVGATMPNLNTGILSAIPMRLPSLTVQYGVASFLEVMKARIDLLRQTNATLEAIAQALFKSWFVDFVPVYAKAEGRAPEAMDAATAAIFPSEFEESELGLIPKGWQVSTLSEHTDAERGLSYKGAGLTSAGDGLPMHNLNSVLEGGGYKYAGIKHYKGAYKERHLAEAGDIIVANTEQGHHHKLIGFPAIVPHRFTNGIFSHHLYRVRAQKDSPITRHWLYYCLMTSAVRDQIIGCSNGSTVNMLKPAGLQIPQMVVPPAKLCRAFDAIAEDLRTKIEGSVDRAETLAQLRDTLLPRLISGKLRLPEACELAEVET